MSAPLGLGLQVKLKDTRDGATAYPLHGTELSTGGVGSQFRVTDPNDPNRAENNGYKLDPSTESAFTKAVAAYGSSEMPRTPENSGRVAVAIDALGAKLQLLDVARCSTGLNNELLGIIDADPALAPRAAHLRFVNQALERNIEKPRLPSLDYVGIRGTQERISDINPKRVETASQSPKPKSNLLRKLNLPLPGGSYGNAA